MNFNTKIKESIINRINSIGNTDIAYDDNLPEETIPLTDNLSLEAELAAYLNLSASIIFKGSGRINIRFESELDLLTERFAYLCEKLFSADVAKVSSQKSEFGGRTIYIALIEDSAVSKEILHYFSIAEFYPTFSLNNNIDRSILQNEQSLRHFVRGAFLCCGYLNDPRSSYMVQFSIRHKSIAEDMKDILKKLGLSVNLRQKDSYHVITIRKAEDISDLMAFCEAYSAVLLFQEEKTLKDMNNTMNRKVNCDTANIQKTVEASIAQISAINKLINSGRFQKLPEKLIQTAQLRLDNPEESLSELAKISSPPVSRSTLDKRLRKLIQLADEI
ncbi:MAG: DNA-binding protein WhiA [Anaerofustis stercorihominis]|nr:DNA-binding protein WhiA [Anaerofustis stercorihominis]